MLTLSDRIPRAAPEKTEGVGMPTDAKQQPPKPQPQKEPRPTPVFTDFASI
ncbi:MAG: hypothetical protein AAF822_14080 [Pseudomonadota bacterium]